MNVLELIKILNDLPQDEKDLSIYCKLNQDLICDERIWYKAGLSTVKKEVFYICDNTWYIGEDDIKDYLCIKYSKEMNIMGIMEFSNFIDTKYAKLKLNEAIFIAVID